jgi:hypothetical protein
MIRRNKRVYFHFFVLKTIKYIRGKVIRRQMTAVASDKTRELPRVLK